jgi:hypothetical protein
MPDLKLGRLPDRVPVKYTFAAPPDLNRALLLYSELYKESYGEEETIPTLVPFMLQAFLDGDRAFQKALRERFTGERVPEDGPSRRQAGSSSAPT